MRAEADAVLADAVFGRSPVLSRLLRYLVEETVAGRSAQLKSFVVAIDGLGRGQNFDATSDSSARVQMVRLRKTLEGYYAKHGPIDELCIYLQPGSYTVRLGRLPTAYPMLYRPLSDTAAKPVIAPFEPPAPVPAADAEYYPISPQPLLRFYRRRPIVTACALAGFLGALLAIGLWQLLGAARTPQMSPVLELMPMESSASPDIAPMSRLVSSSLASALPRFKLSRVRVVNYADATHPPGDPANSYRLFSRLENNDENGFTLYLSLDDTNTDTLLWSREVFLPADRKAAFDALVPVFGEINGPMGIIATHGSIVHKHSSSGGYPCLLKYFQFVRTRSSALENDVANCLEQPVQEQRMQATILAARAFFVTERSGARDNFEAVAQQARALARAAVAADPTDGAANYAVARYSYLAGDCASARFYTDRTMETNPYSPMFMATLAGLSNMCDYPGAERLLDQAFLTQSPQFAKGRLLLVLGAIGQGRPEKIAELASSDLPHSRYNRINYYLTETLIAASQSRRADAARYWRLFSQTIPQGSKTADAKLRPIVPLVAMRRKVIAQLRDAGVIERGE